MNKTQCCLTGIFFVKNILQQYENKMALKNQNPRLSESLKHYCPKQEIKIIRKRSIIEPCNKNKNNEIFFYGIHSKLFRSCKLPNEYSNANSNGLI